MEQKDGNQIKKRNIALAFVLFFLVCISVIIAIYKINQKKEHDILPLISHVDNYKEYSPEELKLIVDKSDYCDIGAYLNLLSDKDRKNFIRRCKDFTKKDELTKYIFAEDGTVCATKTMSIYEKAIEDYKTEVDSLTPLGKKYLEMEKQKKQDEEEHVENAISTYAAKDIEDLGKNPITEYGSLAKYKVKKRQEDGYDADDDLMSKTGIFYLGIDTLEEYTVTMKEHKKITDISEIGSQKDSTTKVTYSEAINTAFGNYLPPSQTYMKISFTANSQTTKQNENFKITDVTVKTDAMHGFKITGKHEKGLRAASNTDRKKGEITNNFCILYLNFSYTVNNNKVPYSSKMFDYSGLGCYGLSAYPMITGTGDNLKFVTTKSININGTEFKVNNKSFDSTLATWGFKNDQPDLYENFTAKINTAKDGVVYSFGEKASATDTAFLQINLGANTTAGISRLYTLEYYANAIKHASNNDYEALKNAIDN